MQKMPPQLFFVPPMECKEVKRLQNVPRGPEYGYRGIALKQHNEAEVYSRNGLLFEQFPNLYEAVAKLPRKSFILDGEIVALDEEGRSNFNALQRSRTRPLKVHFYAFDLLNLDDDDLTAWPLSERQALLWRSFPETEFIHLPRPLDAELDEVVAKLRQFGFEGVVAKRRDSVYQPGKTPGTWIKKKLKQTGKFLVGGYIPGNVGVDNILIGELREERLQFVETVDDGFIPATRRQIHQVLNRLQTDRCPFQNLLGRETRKHLDREKLAEAHWVEPKAMVEVAFNERTPGNHLRHAEFVRLIKSKTK